MHQLEAGHDERRLPGPRDQLVVDERRVLGEDLPVRPEPDAGAGDALLDPACPCAARTAARTPRSGPSPANTPGNPRWNDIRWVAGERSTSTSSRAESALTTEEPTPCRPPVATYEPPPNLPPACSLVKTTSTPDSPVFGSLSTGMPRPLSWTSAEPSGCSVTSILVQSPASASSTRVVDDLPQAVHEPAGVGGADVHARPLADRLEPLEDEQVLGVVGVVDGCCLCDGGGRVVLRSRCWSESTGPARWSGRHDSPR